jgi:hypothetical protein
VLLLWNGTHRSYDLLRAGHNVVPALVVEHAMPNEVPWITNNPQLWVPPVLLSPRPPMLADFNSELAVQCLTVTMPSMFDVSIGQPPGRSCSRWPSRSS